MSSDEKKLNNLIIEIKEGQSITCDGPVIITLIEAARNNNRTKSLISFRATHDVKIKKNELSKNS